MPKSKSKSPYTEDRVMRVLQNLTHKQLQRECVLRGLSPEDVVGLSHQNLVSWFYKNFDNPEDISLLAIFDAWVDDQLYKKGYKKGDALMSPALKFGITGDMEKMDRPREPKPQNDVPKKDRKEKAQVDEKTGVRAGTKKAMTYQMALEGAELDATVKAVVDAFPGAEPKSIKIWFKRALKEGKKNGVEK